MLLPGEQSTTKSTYTATVNTTLLASKIADTAMSVINGAKVNRKAQRIVTQNNGKDTKVEDYDISDQLPEDAISIIVNAIAYAVAKELVTEIQTNLEIQMGNLTLTAGSLSGSLTGVGGGVVGPVTVFGGSVASETGIIMVPPGAMK